MAPSCKQCLAPQDPLNASTASRQATRPTCAKTTPPASNAERNTYPKLVTTCPTSPPSRGALGASTSTNKQMAWPTNMKKSTNTPA
ncbi:hypothetical protein O181_098452 [Austropuccinia psidii MF-1]|uniref:Uncharacterized protein n=1 Tax=Austropuccinia psidii MF-1 TaxID=1389203 RepID=A0A9Q3JB98_9BASI|nr:hypothetical protein [Austropuccinia psidii MF-1]